jgi:asparagine synthase (glutamine-hydrolysing)
VCGIAGIVGPMEAGGASAASAMIDLLDHRGPDDRRVDVIAGPITCVLGHTRLRVIDLSDDAAQPMKGERGDVAVVFNGEIYNFAELRRELESKGHVFRSKGDTEVIVHGYEEYGEGIVSRLDGMFALAVWDQTRARLLLARDRLGKKPLFYSVAGDQLVFASSITAVRRHPSVPTEVDWSRTGEYIALGYVPGPRTFLEGIEEVPPAHYVLAAGSRPAPPKRYWELEFSPVDGPLPILGERIVRRTDDLLNAAVRRRLVADVPLGVLLSGGLDSSLIVAMMAAAGLRPTTFTATFGDDATFDERRWARVVAKRFGTDHHEVVVRADASVLLERLLWHCGQPFGDSSMVATYLVAQAARRFVTVALTGDGGDETFAGYERFRAALAADRLPPAVQEGGRRFLGIVPRTDGYFDLRSRAERFLDHPRATTLDRYREWVSVSPAAIVSGVVRPEALGRPWGSFDEALERYGPELPLLHRLMGLNLLTYLPGDLLVKADSMTMADSLETRSPYLDRALVESVASLPASAKGGVREGKRILRAVARRYLPREIVDRRKHGFGVPVARWLRGPLGGTFRDAVLAQDAATRDVLVQPAVEDLLEAHLRGADHGQRLWTILCLELWARSLTGPTGPASDGVEVS